MPATKEFSYRLEILDVCLRRFGKRWDIDALLKATNEKLEEQWRKKISKRTLFNDLKHLTDELHAPVEKITDNGKVYYSYSDKDFSIRNLPLVGEDVGYLREAVTMLRQISSIAIVDEMEAIISRLEHTATVANEPAAPMILFEQHSQATGSQHLDDLLQAIRGKLPLLITYRSFQMTAPEIWCVHPYLLKEYRGRWFLIGRKDALTVPTVLALDRMQKLKPATTAFIENDLFDPQNFYHHLVGVTFPTGEEIQEIIIKVRGIQCAYIRTKPIHTTQMIIEDLPDDYCMVLTLSLINNYELRSHLLSYGPGIEVLSPASLRDQMKTLFVDGAQTYF